MQALRPTRTEALVAAACGAWAAAFFAPEGAAAVAVAPLLGLAILPFRRRPETAGLCVLVATLLAAAAGVSEENAGGLAAGLTSVYALGRYAGARGLLVVGALAVGIVAPGGPAPIDVVFVAVVLGAVWACGRLIGHRTERARRAGAVTAALAAQDPGALAARVVAEERARLAGEALAVVRRAVDAMQRDAIAAEAALDPCALSAVQDGGRAAVADLRRLLGLLRSEDAEAGQADAGQADAAPAARAMARRRPPRTDVLTAAALMALGVVETAVLGPAEPGSLLLTLAIVACLALRRLDAALACVLAAVPAGLAAVLDAPLVYGFAQAAALGLLAWSAADGRPRALAALALLAAVSLAVIHADDPGNEGMVLAILGLPAVAGHLWATRGREGDAAAAMAATLRATHQAAAERATKAERLRLARELHDVASHAVGVMVLQAGAALALRERDPAAARAAVRAVREAGSAATAELDVLFGVLDGGAVGPPGLATPAADFVSALHALVERIRGAGLDVGLRVPVGLAPDAEVAAVALRVVQEALTNAVRHAPRSRVVVELGTGDGGLVVEVRDDGPGAGAHEPGFGLVGLGERVRAVGGELRAGPAQGGGFAVSARLPGAEQVAGAGRMAAPA